MRALAVAALLFAVTSPALAQRDVAAKHFEQAEAYMKAEQYDLAAAEYEKAYAALPKAGFLFNIGLAYERAGDPDNAAASYRRYIAADPDGAKVEEARARATALEREVADAAAARSAEEQRQRDAERQRARVDELLATSVRRRSTGDIAGAVAALRTAHELTQDPERLFDIAELHLEAGKAVDAKVHFEGYVAASPTGPRHLQARKHIETIAAELAAAAREPEPPGPWSIGAKIGPSTSSPTTKGSTSCDGEPSTAITGGGFVGVRFYDYLSVRGELLVSYRPIDVHCPTENISSDADTGTLRIPLTLGLDLVRRRAAQVVFYVGPEATLPFAEADLVEGVGPALSMLGGIEVGVGVGRGTILFDLRVARSSETFRWEHTDATVLFDNPVSIFALVGYRHGDRPQ